MVPSTQFLSEQATAFVPLAAAFSYPFDQICRPHGTAYREATPSLAKNKHNSAKASGSKLNSLPERYFQRRMELFGLGVRYADFRAFGRRQTLSPQA
jgi:hypothetical protein